MFTGGRRPPTPRPTPTSGGRVRNRALALAVLVALLAGCSSNSEPAEPRAQGPSDAAAPTTTASTTTSTSSTTSTTSTTAPAPATDFQPLIADPALSPQAQVEAAYLYYWDVLLESLKAGRPELLELVYAEPMLRIRSNQLSSVMEDGHRVHGYVEHNYAITVHSADRATVVDHYRNFMVLVDAQTGTPIEDPPNSIVMDQFEMRKVDGRWMVADLIGYTPDG